MSGVQAGTRLERLETLWRRTHHDIEVAQHHGQVKRLSELRRLEARLDEEILAAGGRSLRPESGRFEKFQRRRPAVRRSRGQKAEDRVSKHLERLGVSSNDVKVWAVGQGLLTAVKRGRIRGELVDAYEVAHRGEGAA